LSKANFFARSSQIEQFFIIWLFQARHFKQKYLFWNGAYSSTPPPPPTPTPTPDQPIKSEMERLKYFLESLPISIAYPSRHNQLDLIHYKYTNCGKIGLKHSRIKSSSRSRWLNKRK
jgi:hypothetical protein